MQKLKNIDIILIVISLALVLGLAFGLALYPQQGLEIASKLLKGSTYYFGVPTMVTCFILLIFLVWLSMSKYGNIRLGKTKPKFSTFSWLAMMFSAGLGGSSVYWGFLEWGYYYNSPPSIFGPLTEAGLYETSIAYQIFHWGPTAWTLYTVFALPIAYHFYVRKREGMSLSKVFGKAIGKYNSPFVSKIVDIIFVFGVVAALGTTLGLGTPLICAAIGHITGIKPGFGFQVGLMILISFVYCMSSYVGLEKGMRKISDSNAYLTLGLAIFVLIAGPTIFILRGWFSGLGIAFQNFVEMSLWTDFSAGNTFTEDWTVFYWLYWAAFGPSVGIFIAKVSEGRKIKHVIMAVVLGAVGVIACFNGILNMFTMHLDITGQLNVADLLAAGETNNIIIGALEAIPYLGPVAFIIFSLAGILLLATSLDGASFALAVAVMKDAGPNANPSPINRLFWCIICTVFPIAFLIAGASLDTIKTFVTISGIPVLIIAVVLAIHMMKDIKEDYGDKTKKEILDECE